MRRHLPEPFGPNRHARPPCSDAGDLLRVAARSAGGRRRVVVEVVGEVDHYTAPLLGDCLRTQCERRGLRELVVDMAGVTFLAGAGLTVLAQARQRCSTRGVRLRVRCSGRRAVLRPLELAGLSDLLLMDRAARRSPGAGTCLATVVHPPVAVGPDLVVCEDAYRVGGPQLGSGGGQSQGYVGQPWRAE